jgi:NTP pyrophosphatase (non-canonical NTP hydrolase)
MTEPSPAELLLAYRRIAAGATDDADLVAAAVEASTAFGGDQQWPIDIDGGNIVCHTPDTTIVLATLDGGFTWKWECTVAGDVRRGGGEPTVASAVAAAVDAAARAANESQATFDAAVGDARDRLGLAAAPFNPDGSLTLNARTLLDLADAHAPKVPTVYQEIQTERERAHLVHGATSNEASPWDSDRRLRVLVEEVGEVAKAFNDHEHNKLTDGQLRREVRKELIQVAAMAASWADSVPRPEGPGCPHHRRNPHPTCPGCWDLEPEQDPEAVTAS